MQLGVVKSREALKPQREPYWQKLAAGQYLGFRPSRIGKGGTWIARAYDADARKNSFHSLGDFGHLPANERFTAASAEARAWFDNLAGGGGLKPMTVKEACERYVEEHPEATWRLERFVYDDPIAKVKLHKLTDKQVREWRKRLESRSAFASKRQKGKQPARPRTASTINRDIVPFRAALNMALERGDVLTARAWGSALKPAEASGRRHLYLDKDQRRALLAVLPDDLKHFCRGLCLLPLRPGALAALTVGDFNSRTGELVILKDKTGGGRKILLPPDTAALMKEQCKSKLPAAPLFACADGSMWTSPKWGIPIREAVAAATLPKGASAYTLRHSTITDLVTSGLDLFTVAQVSGTSVAMIEKHYGHLQQHRAAQALAGLAL